MLIKTVEQQAKLSSRNNDRRKSIEFKEVKHGSC